MRYLPGLLSTAGGIIIMVGGGAYICMGVEKAVRNGEVFTEHPTDRSAPAGLSIALQGFGDQLISLGASPEALHRVAAFATSTFDSLPMAGSTLGALAICGQNHKQAYFPIFVNTVLITTIAMVLSALLMTWFPGLA